jgi:hypothetical protein
MVLIFATASDAVSSTQMVAISSTGGAARRFRLGGVTKYVLKKFFFVDVLQFLFCY